MALKIDLSDGEQALLESLLWAHCAYLDRMLADDTLHVSQSALEASLGSAEALAERIGGR